MACRRCHRDEVINIVCVEANSSAVVGHCRPGGRRGTRRGARIATREDGNDGCHFPDNRAVREHATHVGLPDRPMPRIENPRGDRPNGFVATKGIGLFSLRFTFPRLACRATNAVNVHGVRARRVSRSSQPLPSRDHRADSLRRMCTRVLQPACALLARRDRVIYGGRRVAQRLVGVLEVRDISR